MTSQWSCGLFFFFLGLAWWDKMLTLLISTLLLLFLQLHVHPLRYPSGRPVTPTLCPFPGKPLRDLCPTWLLLRAAEVIGRLATPTSIPAILSACSVDRLIEFMFLVWMTAVLDRGVKFAFLKQVRLKVSFWHPFAMNNAAKNLSENFSYCIIGALGGYRK